jgi:ArsR family transcriptional regulator
MQIAACPHERAVEVFKAVSDPLRVRMLCLLLEVGELCVCEFETVLEIGQTRASRQLATLRRAGLVVDRRQGAWAYYSIPEQVDPVAAAVLAGLGGGLENDPVLAADVARRRGEECCG